MNNDAVWGWITFVLVVVTITASYSLTKDAHTVVSQWWFLSEVSCGESPSPRSLLSLAACTAFHWYWTVTTPHTWVNLWCAWIYSIVWLIKVPIAAVNGFQASVAHKEDRLDEIAQVLLLDCFGIPCIAVGLSLNRVAVGAVHVGILVELLVRWIGTSTISGLTTVGYAIAALLSVSVVRRSISPPDRH